MQGIQVSKTGRVHVIGCGRPIENPPPLLAARAQSLFRSLREEYESIILDTPPVNVVADAAILGPHSDGVIVVARAGATEMQALAFAIGQLRHVGAPVLGAVLNDVDFRHDGAYDEAYRYYARADAYGRHTS
jgi:Mrp family chromosome partitioning ATPase